MQHHDRTRKISVSLGIWQGNGATRRPFVSLHKRRFHHNTTYFDDMSSLHIWIKRNHIEPCETSTSSFRVTSAIMYVMSFVTMILLRNSHIIWWNSRRWGMLLDAVIMFNGRPQELIHHLQRTTRWFSLLCLWVDECPCYLAMYSVIVSLFSSTCETKWFTLFFFIFFKLLGETTMQFLGRGARLGWGRAAGARLGQGSRGPVWGAGGQIWEQWDSRGPHWGGGGGG